jgi:hypothetical protein
MLHHHHCIVLGRSPKAGAVQVSCGLGRWPEGLGCLSYHRFKIAQTVISVAPDMPPGPFVIVRLLPPVSGEPRYRVISTIAGFERVVLESQIKVMAEPEAASVRLLLSMHIDDDARP